jgi:hypothetical protein
MPDDLLPDYLPFGHRITNYRVRVPHASLRIAPPL